MRDYLTGAELRKALGISTATYFRWLREKRIRGVRIGRNWRFPPALVRELLAGEDATADLRKSASDWAKLSGVTMSKSRESGEALLESVLHHAAASRASQIHLEPGPGGLAVRHRVDGLLGPAAGPVLPPRAEAAFVRLLREKAGAAAAPPAGPWKGRFVAELSGRAVDVCIAACPTTAGPSLTLQVIDPETAVHPLDKLGFPLGLTLAVRKALSRHGLFVVNGPTGCGKTTTLYSLVRELVRPELKVMTAENPVELRLEGVQQVQISAPDFDFAAAIEAMIHADVDVAMIAEVRDAKSLQRMLPVASGRKVLTVLHAPDAAAAYARILELGGAECRSLALDNVSGILDQRLARRACPDCTTRELPKDDDARTLGLPRRKVAVSKGCAACRQTGVKGSAVVAGLFTVTPAVRAAVEAGGGLDAIRAAAGPSPLRKALVELVLEGEIAPAEARRVLGE